MNNKYNAHFYLKNNTLKCIMSDGNKKVNLNEKTAIQLLKEADKEKYNLRLKHGVITLIGDRDNITITIDENILSSHYKYLARKTYKKLKKTSKEYMKYKYKGKEVKKSLVRGALIGASPIAAVFLAVTLSKPEKTNNIDAMPIAIESIENINDTNSYVKTKEIVSPNYLSNIDDLFVEKEEIQEINEDDFVEKEDYLIEELEPMDTYYSNIDLDIEDRSQEDDVIAIREKYGEEALRAQNRWGIDARILLAILTQESHDNDQNLTQITFDAYADQILNVYNFQEERYMKVVFTNNPDKFRNEVDMTLSEEELKNPLTIIGATAIIINNNNLNDYNAILNPSAMIDQYNKGLTKFTEVLDYTPGSREEILGNPNNIDFIAYDKACGVGDPDYVLNTMQYVDQNDGPLIIYTFNKNKNGDKYPVRVQYIIDKTLSKQRSL